MTNRKYFQEKIFLGERVILPSLSEQRKLIEQYKNIDGLLLKLSKSKLSLKEFEKSFLNSLLKNTLVKPKSIVAKTFYIQQAIAAILEKGFKRGEMVIAKVLYLAQEIYEVPLDIAFSPQNFGPYDSVVKVAITSGSSKNNQFFSKQSYLKGYVYSLGKNAKKILQYANSPIAKKMQTFLDEMYLTLNKADSASIERLATVCKIIQDNKSSDEILVKNKMQEWKPNKFTTQEVEQSLKFIKSKGWDRILVK